MRGIQRMIEEGQGCTDIADQMVAVRRAVDSAYARMVACFLEAELQSRLELGEHQREALGEVLKEVQGLLGKAR